MRHDSGKVLYFEVIADDASHMRAEQRLRHVHRMEARSAASPAASRTISTTFWA